MNDGDSPEVEFGQGENRGLGRRCSGGGVKTKEGVVDGGTFVMTRNNYFFVKVLG